MTDNTELVQRAVQEAIADGEAAKQLLDNPFYQRLIKGLKDAYSGAWMDEPDAAKREKLHGMACAVRDIELNVKQSIDRAIAARSRLADAERLREAEERSGPLA